MSKLTQIEKDELKHHVLDSIVRRLTTKETQEYIKEKMNGLDISFSYLLHIRALIRKDSMKQLQTYQKDRVAFIEEIFTKPVEELKLMKKTLHRIIENEEEEDTEVRIKAINQLQNVNSQMLSYYNKLPEIIGAINQVVNINNNNNNPAAAPITTANNNNKEDGVKYAIKDIHLIRMDVENVLNLK